MAQFFCFLDKIKSFSSQPRSDAPRSITSREQPAANFGLLYFLKISQHGHNSHVLSVRPQMR